MTEVLASRSFRGLATEDAINDVHNDMDSLWLDVPFVNDMDQMTFTTAVIESASNIVQHAEPAAADPVELGVDITVEPLLLQARVSAYNAKPPFGPMEPATPGEDAESGRGLALIQALVTTVTFERQDGTSTWVLSRTSSQD
ncbi:putative anti-sigma regulatory factor, serine/threonine protein kinase [Pseudarthrobacter chlorophenolicus A6]|uniref:Anti-sigma regulatory factor, serine/threonine protein kinase n=1 Tax=Pseudarthrobacter chlorophenolicus (strain ATCC 700700 / DSM 12829 / CIP 107037 / JCM 12360 / KCTC 9906 / NCIMB 13794 / A6) TaxID=452863 RepID=B8HHB8_PSECP|nr:ATP-binding protein [Pseudarthrobacter chlorophenolicus]ACL41409.1 putative anti-sigma regulatory factor, serine/threonine protein kinase [Pseudarthrobacter chlorophenolicus A6]SDQ64656.1 serine/threonine-protein kinase RsbW [Pseudarthrobacter chlorophenolicus]